jgi:hypothetical protein
MSTDPHPAASRATAPRRPHRTAGRRAVAGLVAVVTMLTLAACDLRLETADPAEPVPDAAETLRRDAVDDALALETAAGLAATTPDGSAEAVAAVLGTVASTAATQVTALGGVYESGLPAATTSPSATATVTTSTPAEVLTLLTAGTVSARTAALAAEDGGTARVLAAVAASRAQLATRLAAALGVEAPVVDTAVAASDAAVSGGDADGSGSGDGSAAAPSTAPAASATTPVAAGTGLTRTALLALVAAEDQAGYGFEVAAARLDGTDRESAQAAAAAHRATASTWAALADLAGSTDDPRRVTYALGADLGSADAVRTFCSTLDSALATAYADAVVQSTAGTDDRAVLVDGLRESAVAALAWGATPTALPGVPDSVVAATPGATDAATEAAEG